MKQFVYLVGLVIACLPAVAGNAARGEACLPKVRAAVEAAYPGGHIVACAEEHEDEAIQWDVVLDTKEKKRIELDVSPDGTILATEEAVDLATVPAAVMQQFHARYPGVEATGAAKETEAAGAVFYEITFGKREAKFTNAGTLVEEEEETEEDP